MSDSTSTGGALALAIAYQAGPIEMTYNNTQASLSATGPLPVNLSTLSADFVYTLDVTYVYDDGQTEVPVPAALPLLAAAFGVMGFVRSRRG